MLVEPGVSRTAFEENLVRVDRPLQIYESVRQRQEALLRDWVATGDAPEVVADTVAATVVVPALSDRQLGRHVRFFRLFFPEIMVDRPLRKVNKLPV